MTDRAVTTIEQPQETAPDGTQKILEVPVGALADEFGKISTERFDWKWRAEVLLELRRIRKGLSMLVDDPLLDDDLNI